MQKFWERKWENFRDFHYQVGLPLPSSNSNNDFTDQPAIPTSKGFKDPLQEVKKTEKKNKLKNIGAP